MTKRTKDYAKRRGYDEKTIKELEEKFEKIKEAVNPHYHATGFAHPDLVCFTNEEPYEPLVMNWGLVPFWVKDEEGVKKIHNRTLNARGESIFEKNSFREAAKKRRCLICVDAFFEHYHYKGNTYPHLIKLKNDEPMMMGGLWERCELDSGKVIETVSIVTTKANELLEKIHNNPKMSGPRMPFILPKELENEWLKPSADELDEEELGQLIQPYDAGEMEAYTVRKIRGKNSVGNSEEAVEPYEYEQLER